MSTNDIPPAVTLYWQEERIKELEIEVARLTEDYQRMVRRELDIAVVTAENEQLRTVLAATQKALKEMQAERDKAREGKR